MLLDIEKLVYGGDGLARSEGHVVLAPFVLPGEQVEAETERAKNDLLRGRVTTIYEASPERVQAPCPYFQHCGGCHYQHARYKYQLDQKQAILREVLRRVGKILYEGEIEIVSGEPWHYRNRIQLHIENGAVGYYELGSHRLCPIESCPISSPRLNEAIAALSRDLPAIPPFRAAVELFTNETDLQVAAPAAIPDAARMMLDRLGTRGTIEYAGFRVSGGSFFQVNRFLIDRLVEVAAGDAEGNVALDLYAGVGLFSRSLGSRFARVIAVESGTSAYRDLRHNVVGIEAVHGLAEAYLAKLLERPDFIIADPPRAGLGKQAVSELVRIRAAEIRIVSCDPATLARDLMGLVDGGYTIESVALLDLFPHTYHIETAVRLRMKS